MKAILVIDMPNECDECPCLNRHLWECRADKKRRSSDERPDWCPLKPLPERRAEHYTDALFGQVENLTNIGYNRCLKDIEGEE